MSRPKTRIIGCLPDTGFEPVFFCILAQHFLTRGLACHYVGDFRLYLYGSTDYLDAFGIPRSVEDLENHSFVGYIQDLIKLDAVRWLDEIITRPRMAFQSNSMLAQMSACASGLGLALLPKFSVINETGLIPVLHDVASVRRELWVSVHQDLQFSKRVALVQNFLRTVFKANLDWLNGPPDAEARGRRSFERFEKPLFS